MELYSTLGAVNRVGSGVQPRLAIHSLTVSPYPFLNDLHCCRTDNFNVGCSLTQRTADKLQP